MKNKPFLQKDEELQFTAEDRQNVLTEIKKLEARPLNKTSRQTFVPVVVTCFIIAVCVLLFIPSLLSPQTARDATTSRNEQPLIQSPATEQVSTTLISVKSKAMDNRVYVNLVMSYHKQKKKLNIVSLPAEIYAPMMVHDDGTTAYDKLLFSYQFGGANNVKQAVSTVMDALIDDYVVIDVETIEALVQTMNEITYTIPANIRVRGITEAAITFSEGTHPVNGEELIALLMAATEGTHLPEEHIVQLVQTVIDTLNATATQPSLEQLLTQIETTMPIAQFVEKPLEVEELALVSLRSGIRIETETGNGTAGSVYYTLDEDFLQTVVELLTTF